MSEIGKPIREFEIIEQPQPARHQPKREQGTETERERVTVPASPERIPAGVPG